MKNVLNKANGKYYIPLLHTFFTFGCYNYWYN